MSALAGLRVRMIAFRQHDRVARLWRESQALAEAGAVVDVYLLRQEGQAVDMQLAPRVRVVRVTSARPDSRRPWQALRGYTAFVRAIGRSPADVYHCLDGATLPVGVILARRDRARLVYDAADYFTDHFPAPPFETRIGRVRRRYTSHYLWEQLLIRRADARITVSEGIATLLVRRYRLNEEPAVVANFAPYLQAPEGSRRRLRDAVGADAGERLVVFIGSVHEHAAYALEGDRHRGLDVAVDAVASLERARLVVIGSNPAAYRASVLARAESRGAANRISFFGPAAFPDYVELAAGGDVGVYLIGGSGLSASYANTLPNRLFDFIMARVPVVVSAGTASARIVADYQIGAVVERLEAARVAGAIDILSNGAGADERSANLDRAARELCWERESTRLVKLYSGLVSAG